MSDRDRILHCPFVILVDTNEGHPFSFVKIRSDAAQNYRYWHVETRRVCLGRYPHSLGDYTIQGFGGRVAIERKSLQDFHGTLLGWGDHYEESTGRRERFESELSNLNQVDAAVVIIEADLKQCLEEAPEWGKKSAELNCKILQRTWLSYQQRFPRVQWQFWWDRRSAEVGAFRWLYRYWRKNTDGKGKSQGIG